MKLLRKAGATSNIFQVFAQDSSSTTGAGLTGLAFNTSSLTAYYHRDTDTTATAITLVTMTVGTFTSSGFKEIDATNMPGWYQFCPPDAAIAASAKSCGIHIKGATNLAPLPIEVQLVAFDPDDAVHLGLTSLPNTAVTTNASLLTSGTGTDQLSVASGRIDAGKILGTAISAPATAGILDVNVKNINNVAAATPGASGGVLISGSNSGTTTLGALTVTGATTHTGGLAIAAGATITGSTNGVGLTISGGGASGAGLVVNTTSGDAVQITPTAGHGVNIAANGTSKHGVFATGGTAGTSDGIKAAAGSGGVDIRGNITGNLVGTVSTLTTYTNNTPQTGDAYLRLGAPAGASTAADIAAVKVDTAAVKVQTDKLAFTVTNQVDANVLGVAASASNIKKNQALSQFVFLMTDSTNHNPATGLTVSGFRSIDGAAFAATNTTTATEIANGFYKIPLAASDLNGNVIALRFTATAADDQDITIVTQP